MAKTKAKYCSIELELTGDMKRFAKNYKQVLADARDLAVDAMGEVWADGAKDITRTDHHIDTGAYINSIGIADNYSGKDGNVVCGPIINSKNESGSVTRLNIGSGVSYALILEKRYNIFNRGLNKELDRMSSVGSMVVKNYLKNRM